MRSVALLAMLSLHGIEGTVAFGANNGSSDVPLVREKGSDTVRLSAPEVEIQEIYSELGRLEQAVNGLPRVSGQPVIGPRKVAAERAWSAAQQFIAAGNHISGVRELNKYLNLVQTGEAERYLVAQRQLALSYNALGQSERSMRAAFRYVGAFVAQTQGVANYDDLVETLRLVARLARAYGRPALVEVKQLFATLGAVEMPAKPKMQIMLLAARVAGASGDLKMARKFLGDPVLRDAGGAFSGEAAYLRGILEVLSGRMNAGRLAFKAAAAAFGSENSEMRDRARLAIARIQLRQGHADLAAATYAGIDEGSPSYRDALFEGIYALIELGSDQEARDAASIYKKQFSSHDRESQMRLARMDAWLAMRIGDLSAAQAAISSQRDAYMSVLDQSRSELDGSGPVDQETVKNIFMKHDGLVDPPEEIDVAWRMIGRIDIREAELDDADGVVRQVFTELGKARLSDLNPSWMNQTRAIDAMVRRQLELGHRLIALQKHLLSGRLTPSEKHELDASERRRTMLLSRYAKTLGASEGWRKTADLFDSIIRLDRINEKLLFAEANLAPVRFAASSGSKFTDEMKGLETTPEKVRTNILRALELVRAQQITGLADGSEHRQLRRLMGFYSMAIFDEEAVLARARDLVSDTAQRLLVMDLDRAWRLWAHVSRSAYTQIDRLDKAIVGDLRRVVSEFWEIDDRIQRADQEIVSIKHRLGNWVGSRREGILNTVSRRVAERVARLDKWSADIDAMRSEQVQKTAADERLGFELQRQSARDEILDLQVGGPAVWLD